MSLFGEVDKSFVHVSLVLTVMAESPSHSLFLISGILSASSRRNVTPTREETEDSEPSILDPGLQPAPFQPGGSGLVVASIPPPHLSSETASPPRQGEAGPEIAPPSETATQVAGSAISTQHTVSAEEQTLGCIISGLWPSWFGYR